MKDRNSTIEILRILACIGVIVLHYNRIVESIDGQPYVYIIMESASIVSVDIFVAIAALFLVKKSERDYCKVFSLLLLVSFSRCAFYLVECCKGKTFSLLSFFGNIIPMNWFILVYCAMYLLTPYVNRLFLMKEREFRQLVILCIFLFSIYSSLIDAIELLTGVKWYGADSQGVYGDMAGHSLICFLLIYLIVGYISKYSINIAKNKLFAIYLVMLTFIFLIALAEYKYSKSVSVIYNYNNPLVLCASISVVFLFVALPNVKSKYIDAVSSCTLYVYVVHEEVAKVIDLNRTLIEDNGDYFLVLLMYIVGVFIVAFAYKVLFEQIVLRVGIYLYKKCTSWIKGQVKIFF